MIEVKIPRSRHITYRKSDGVMTAFAWAQEQFGLPGWQGNYRWHMKEDKSFHFTYSEDAVLFALRWS